VSGWCVLWFPGQLVVVILVVTLCSVITLVSWEPNFLEENDSELSVIWPGTDERPTATDRIIAQMKYIPPIKELTPKQILVYNGLRDGMRPGSASFKDQNCPVSACELTSSRAAATTADIILFRDHVSPPSVRRPSGQIWMVSWLVTPINLFIRLSSDH